MGAWHTARDGSSLASPKARARGASARRGEPRPTTPHQIPRAGKNGEAITGASQPAASAKIVRSAKPSATEMSNRPHQKGQDAHLEDAAGGRSPRENRSPAPSIHSTLETKREDSTEQARFDSGSQAEELPRPSDWPEFGR